MAIQYASLRCRCNTNMTVISGRASATASCGALYPRAYVRWQLPSWSLRCGRIDVPANQVVRIIAASGEDTSGGRFCKRAASDIEKRIGARRPSLASILHESGDITAAGPVTLESASIPSFCGRGLAYTSIRMHEESMGAISWTGSFDEPPLRRMTAVDGIP